MDLCGLCREVTRKDLLFGTEKKIPSGRPEDERDSVENRMPLIRHAVLSLLRNTVE